MTTTTTEYATLGKYLNDQQYPIEQPVAVPQMQYPIIPQYSGGYGLNTLTHDYNGVGYYDINKAYACSVIDTKFNIASCPSNQPVAPFPTKETFMPQRAFQEKKTTNFRR